MQIIIHGPQGCGKTRHADLLAQHFHCTEIVDDWSGQTPLPDGALALTNIPAIPFETLNDMRVMSYAEAMRQAAGHAPVDQWTCPCGHQGCDGVSFRRPYSISSEPCSLASAQSSANTATIAD